MTTRNQITNALTVALVAIGIFGGTVGPACAGPIAITNGDFETLGADWTFVPGWTSENAAADWIISGTTWKPDADNDLYFNPGGAVNQDLSHNWSSSDTYVLGITAYEAGWNAGAAGGDAFNIQLREADGTVLWESTSQNVDSTVGAPNYTYTGTGHLFSWNVDASTFSGAGVVEGSQLNIRIVQTGGNPFFDDVTLEVADPPATPGTLIYGK